MKCEHCGVNEAMPDLLECLPCMEALFGVGKQIARGTLPEHHDLQHPIDEGEGACGHWEKIRCNTCGEVFISDWASNLRQNRQGVLVACCPRDTRSIPLFREG